MYRAERDLEQRRAIGLAWRAAAAGTPPRTTREAYGEPRRPHRDAMRWAQGKLATRSGKAVLAVIVILVAARVALPYAIEAYLNHRLAELEGYRGHVEDVDVALIRGAYRIEGLEIVKTDGEVPVPFVSIPSIDISVEWGAILEGAVVAEIVLDRPELNFVAGSSRSASQTGEEADWRALVDDMVPITINRFDVHDGEVHYRDYGARPAIDLRVHQLEVQAHNLSTIRETDEELPADVDLRAVVQSGGQLMTYVRLDPWDEQPTFDLRLELEHLPATDLNPMLRHYVGIDAEEGQAFLYSEISARDGRFRGYVKPMAEGLEVFHLDEEGGFFDKIGDFFVEMVQEVFSNQGSDPDRFAVRVPVSGSFESPDTDMWAAVASVLYNAFIEAIHHGFEDRGWSREDEG